MKTDDIKKHGLSYKEKLLVQLRHHEAKSRIRSLQPISVQEKARTKTCYYKNKKK